MQFTFPLDPWWPGYEATAADDPNTVCNFVVEKEVCCGKRILQCHLHQERVFSVASKVFSVSTLHELWGNVATFWQLQCSIVSQTFVETFTETIPAQSYIPYLK